MFFFRGRNENQTALFIFSLSPFSLPPTPPKKKILVDPRHRLEPRPRRLGPRLQRRYERVRAGSEVSAAAAVGGARRGRVARKQRRRRRRRRQAEPRDARPAAAPAPAPAAALLERGRGAQQAAAAVASDAASAVPPPRRGARRFELVAVVVGEASPWLFPRAWLCPRRRRRGRRGPKRQHRALERRHSLPEVAQRRDRARGCGLGSPHGAGGAISVGRRGVVFVLLRERRVVVAAAAVAVVFSAVVVIVVALGGRSLFSCFFRARSKSIESSGRQRQGPRRGGPPREGVSPSFFSPFLLGAGREPRRGPERPPPPRRGGSGSGDPPPLGAQRALKVLLDGLGRSPGSSAEGSSRSAPPRTRRPRAPGAGGDGPAADGDAALLLLVSSSPVAAAPPRRRGALRLEPPGGRRGLRDEDQLALGVSLWFRVSFVGVS